MDHDTTDPVPVAAAEAVFDDLFDPAEPAEAVDAPQPTIKRAAGAMTIFDIETGPEEHETLRGLFEVDYTRVKGRELLDQEFDPVTVKTGNLKDPKKIEAKIETARKTFEDAKAAAERAMQSAESEQWEEFVAKAALSAVTGRVLAIGYGQADDDRLVEVDTDESGEDALLTGFWERFEEAAKTDGLMIGFNVKGFDLPFLVRRSWKLGVDVPGELLRDGRYWHRAIIDLYELWQCGHRGQSISLDRLCQFLGFEGKLKDVDGADFAGLYLDPATRGQAIAYAQQDIVCTLDVARVMGVT